MSKHVIATKDAPAAIGPYSQGIVAGDFVFVSGQIPRDPQTGNLISGDAAAQARRCLQNVLAVLAAAGLKAEHIVRTGVFVKNLQDFPSINKVYEEFFPTEAPARTTVEVSRLPMDVLVEIDAIAVKK